MSEVDWVKYCEKCGQHHSPTVMCGYPLINPPPTVNFDYTLINPQHYRKGKVECIDAIEAAVEGLDAMEAYYVGSAIKYLYRWKDKGGVNDLKKAKWFIDGCIAYGSSETK